MNCKEFGPGGRETVMLIHGGGLSWWNYRETAELLQNEYHIVLPILDGHAGSDRPFTTIESNAAEILSFIDGELNGELLLLGGLSLGAQVALEMLSQRSGVCRFAMLESAAVFPSRLTHALIGPAFAGSYGLISDRRFARLQFRSLHMREELFEDYYRDSCAVSKTDLIAFMKASTAYTLKDAFSGCRAAVHVFAGERENREIRRSAAAIGAALPGSETHILAGLRHGEFSLNRPAEYVRWLETILGREDRTEETAYTADRRKGHV